MTSTMATAFMICAIALVVLFLAFSMIALTRLHTMEENLEKIALLLTVLANLQGASNDDIARAASSEESPAVTTKLDKKAGKSGK